MDAFAGELPPAYEQDFDRKVSRATEMSRREPQLPALDEDGWPVYDPATFEAVSAHFAAQLSHPAPPAPKALPQPLVIKKRSQRKAETHIVGADMGAYSEPAIVELPVPRYGSDSTINSPLASPTSPRTRDPMLSAAGGSVDPRDSYRSAPLATPRPVPGRMGPRSLPQAPSSYYEPPRTVQVNPEPAPTFPAHSFYK